MKRKILRFSALVSWSYPTFLRTIYVIIPKVRCVIAIVASMIYGHMALAQTEIAYDFNSTPPLSGIEQLSGSAEVVSVAGLTDNGVANNTPVLRPKTVGSPNATGVANLTSFPAGTDYSVTWKEYVTQSNTSYKKGFLLRGSGSGGYATGIKRGYYFMVQNNATTGSVNFRILNSSSTGIADLKNSGAVTIVGFGVSKACWFRASVTGNILKFEYSMDGVTFNTGTTYTDAANLYPSGGMQMVFGIGSGVGQYYYDDIKLKSLVSGSSSIAITDAASYIYNGTQQGPKTATVTGSTGVISYRYSGTGSTVYGPSSMRPIMAGTYQAVATVAADANYQGAVSSPFAFTIDSNPEMPVAAMRRPVSPASPMLLVHADVWAHQPQQVIDLIPLDMRPFVVINLSMSTTILRDRGYDCAESWLNTCAQNGIWAMVQPSSGIQNSFAADTALTAYESLYKKYPNFIGYNFCEQAWGFNTSTFSQRLDLFTNLLTLGYKYGGYLYVNDNFSISNAIFNTISKFKTSAEFANATRVYKDNMIYGDKFTHSNGYYDNESGALGAFLSGHAGNYAIRYDMYSWGWSGKGQIFGPESADRNPDGNRSLFACPEVAMGVPIVEHMMLTGATVIDGPEVPWMSTLYGPYRLPAFNNMIADIFRKVQDGTIRIPTVTEVAARTKVAFVNDADANTTDSLFSGLYAMDGSLKNNRTWFKKSGRYASIPQLYSGGVYETSLLSGAAIVKKSAYKTRWPNEQKKIDEFNVLYAAESKGDMFVSRVNNSWYCYNPWINKDIVTATSIPLKYNTCDSIGLSYPAHTFSVINESGNKLQVYLNNYRTDKNQLWTEYPDDFSWYTLQNTILPQFATNPPDGTFRTSVISVYGSTGQPVYTLIERGSHKASIASATFVNGVYTLSITHNGPVDITIDCSGTATDRQAAPAISTPVAPAQPIAYTGEKEYEAEGAMITSPAVVSNSPKRYHGTGFVKFSSAISSASSVKFKVLNVETAGTYALDIRYSAVQGNVTKVDVLVNNIKVSTPTFPATETDSTWMVYTQKINLNAGTGNTVELKANSSGAVINIDKVILYKKSFSFSFVTADAVQKNSSQVQVDWRVTEEVNHLQYEVLKSVDGNSFTSIFTAAAKNAGDSYYVYLDNVPNTDTCFYKIKAIDKNGVETYSKVLQVLMKTAVSVQAEAGEPGSDWETKSAGDVVYVTSKTDLLNSSFPGNAAKVITYNVTFEKSGTYDLYAKILVGTGAFNDDSYYYANGFGNKNPLADNNEWITCNGLSGIGYTALSDIVGNAGTSSTNQWKWINVSKLNGGEAPASFNVPPGSLTKTFQIGSRENGLQFDKFVFGSSNQSFTVKELDDLAGPNQAPVVPAGQIFVLSEHAPYDSIVGVVLASDVNLGTTLKNWQITGGTGSELFDIDPENGAITLADSTVLDFDTTPSYLLKITVSDGLLTSQEDSVTISLTNENDNAPIILTTTPFTLNEGVADNTAVSTLIATDADDTNQPGYTTLQWAILKGNESAAFGIDSAGTIRVINHSALDFETTTSYSLTIAASDGLNTGVDTVTINIGNENDNAPVIVPPSVFSLNESATDSTIVGTVSATDADDTNQPGFTTLQWKVTGGSGVSIFDINNAGEIFLANHALLDFEITTGYTLLITASDGSNTSTQESVTINITNANDNAPLITASQSFNVVEMASEGTVAGSVLATDADDTNQPGFTTLQGWQITGGSGAALFAIHPGTGEITVTNGSALDFEGIKTYVLIVTSNDGLNTSAVQNLTINVLNINEEPVAKFTANSRQGFAPLPVSFEASASSDPDGNTLSYAWNFGDGFNDTGEIVNHTYTVPGTYTVTLTVNDGLGLSNTSSTTIAVGIGLKVQYKVRQNENNPTDNHIRPFFQLVNIGDKPVPYNELTIRYWYTRENANFPWSSDNTSQQFWCDYAAFGTNKVTGKFVKLTSAVNNADYYLEVGFSLTTSLGAGKNSSEIQTRFNNANWSNFNEVGDYSYDPSKTSYTDWTRVTLYRNGQLIWGIEPTSAARIAYEEVEEVSVASNDWMVYPNPSVDGGFTVETNNFNAEENQALQVMDIQGKQIIHERLKDRIFRNPQKLSSGIYLIRMIKSNGVSIKKFVVR